MGQLCSCFKEEDTNAEDSLLRSVQQGYGTNTGNESLDGVEDNIAYLEQKEQERIQELNSIVNETNDKLIDVSMISNSGIVALGHDIRREHDDIKENDSRSEVQKNKYDKNRTKTVKYCPVPKEEAKVTLNQLNRYHDALFTELYDQMKIKETGDLTMTL